MNKIFFCAICTLLCWTGPASTTVNAESGGDALSLGVETGVLNGNTTYHISDYVGSSGIESELKFPLQTVLAGITMGYQTNFSETRNDLKLRLSWMTNINSGSGKVKDSDWATNDVDIATVGAAHSGLDIYSESDMRLKADVYDIRAILGLGIGEYFKIGPMIGYKHQSFRYEISNVNQVGYGPYAAGYTGSVPGLVGTYKVEYDIPYVGFAGEFKHTLASGDITASAQVGVAPSVTAKDRDDHILRSKLSTANATGRAFLADLGVTWNFSGNWCLGINGEVLSISADGTQNQTYYAGSHAGQSYSVSDKITSTQVTVVANLNYQF